MYIQSQSSSTNTIITEITTVNTEKGVEDSQFKWTKNRLIHVQHFPLDLEDYFDCYE